MLTSISDPKYLAQTLGDARRFCGHLQIREAGLTLLFLGSVLAPLGCRGLTHLIGGRLEA